MIDNIDTGSIALEDLRKHISIIPQDPVLFSGTLRRNLDPFDDFSDNKLWDVLQEVSSYNCIRYLRYFRFKILHFLTWNLIRSALLLN